MVYLLALLPLYCAFTIYYDILRHTIASQLVPCDSSRLTYLCSQARRSQVSSRSRYHRLIMRRRAWRRVLPLLLLHKLLFLLGCIFASGLLIRLHSRHCHSRRRQLIFQCVSLFSVLYFRLLLSSSRDSALHVRSSKASSYFYCSVFCIRQPCGLNRLQTSAATLDLNLRPNSKSLLCSYCIC